MSDKHSRHAKAISLCYALTCINPEHRAICLESVVFYRDDKIATSPSNHTDIQNRLTRTAPLIGTRYEMKKLGRLRQFQHIASSVRYGCYWTRRSSCNKGLTLPTRPSHANTINGMCCGLGKPPITVLITSLRTIP